MYTLVTSEMNSLSLIQEKYDINYYKYEVCFELYVYGYCIYFLFYILDG